MANVQYDFTGRVVMVTGTNGVLGRAVALAFASSGANLALVVHSKAGLREGSPETFDPRRTVILDGVDLVNPGQVADAVAQVEARYGRIDILANTVGGYGGGKPAHETSLETWEKMMTLNARTAFVISRAVIPVMLRQGSGRIIHTASSSGLKARRNGSAYAASKAAVIRLTDALAQEVKKEGINVNCVLPSTIDTPANRASMPNADFSRWVPPEDIAQVFLFLASEGARAIHGAIVPVYGLA